jgi:PAS domain S-box-containing protein
MAPIRSVTRLAPAAHALIRGRWLALLLVALFTGPAAFALNPAEKPSDYIVTRWDAEEGLPHNSVRQVFQTSDGFLWVGTMQGLARFDGLTFTNFNEFNTPGLRSSTITSFAETSDGSFWIGTSMGLVRYRDGKFVNYGLSDGLKADTVNALCVAPDGSLWVGGRGGVTRWVGGKFVNDIDTAGFDTLALHHIFADREGAIWIATGSEALRLKDGKTVRYGSAEGLPGQPVLMIRQTGTGEIVAATQNGLYRLVGERFVAFEQNGALPSRRVNGVLADRAGNLWIGSVGGLDRFTGGVVSPYLDRAGARFSGVDNMFEDREGCLWVGTSTGLCRFTDRRGYTLSTNEGILGTIGLAVYQSRDGSVWMSSWGGGVARFQNGTVRQYAGGGKPLSHESVTCIYQAPDGTMWFGNRGSSIDHLEGEKVTTYVYASGVATSRPVISIHSEPGENLLVGIARRGLVQLVDGNLVPVPEAAEFAAEDVWTIKRLRDGRLVAGTTMGFYERRPDRRWVPLELPGLPSPVVVRSIVEDSAGVTWLATQGRGLVRWTPREARAYSTAEGMVDHVLFNVIDDGLGALWVASSRGLARIRKSDFSAIDSGEIRTLDCMTFGRADGLASGATSGSAAPQAAMLADGRLFTATAKGIAVINPRSVQVNEQPPPVVIESALADDRPLAPQADRSIVVPAGSNRLEIRFTALSLVSPQRIRFRYQLEGSDPTWVEAGRERSARYTHLPPGRYAFHVLACNNDGVWNTTGASTALVVQPRYYQTLGFRIATVGLGFVFVSSLVGLRVRQLKLRQAALARTNAELDQRVRQRTAELSRSNTELQQRELLFRLIFEHAPVGISWKRTALGADFHVNATFRRILDLPADTLPDDSFISDLVHPEDAPKLAERDALVRAGKSDSYTLEQRFVLKDGRMVWALFAAAVVRDGEGRIIQVIALLEDITARKQAEQELAATYKRLMEASRMAGMAEVATGVLHNVGNVLNSVNVSATVLADGLRQSRLSSLFRLTTMLHEHASNIGAFLSEDPKGQRVLPYLDTLADHLGAEQQRFVAEVESLRDNVEHIKEIVARQQSYARLGGLLEKLSPTELVEDALQMNALSLHRHGVEVVREFAPAAHVIAERHKVLQILINVVQNAKQAVCAAEAEQRRICVRIAQQDHKVRFEIADNGVGIPPENLSRIFEHGFTTRDGGHGFGLHSSANAAREMRGSLSVRSDGPGKGAVFTLELPVATDAAVSPARQTA